MSSILWEITPPFIEVIGVSFIIRSSFEPLIVLLMTLVFHNPLGKCNMPDNPMGVPMMRKLYFLFIIQYWKDNIFHLVIFIFHGLLQCCSRQPHGRSSDEQAARILFYKPSKYSIKQLVNTVVCPVICVIAHMATMTASAEYCIM